MAFAFKLPTTGHSWLKPLETFLNWVLALVGGGNSMLAVDAVADSPLPANTYANGTSGVGATLTANANGAFPTVDGVAPLLSQVYLVTNEALGTPTGANNGLYVLTTVGSSSAAWVLTRSTSFDASAKMAPGTTFGVKSGTVYAGQTWQYVGPNAPTVGSSALYFADLPRQTLNRGVVPGARLAFSANPANLDTLSIGGVTFQFLTTLVAATTSVQVKRGGSAAATLANTIAAINGDATNTNWVEATTPFAGKVYADASTATELRIRNSRVRGSRPVAGVAASTVLAASITGGASAWTEANLTETGSRNSATSEAAGKMTISAADITAGVARFELGFTPTWFVAQAFSSAGVQRAYSDATSIDGDSIKVVLGGGASPNLQANDVLTVVAGQ